CLHLHAHPRPDLSCARNAHGDGGDLLAARLSAGKGRRLDQPTLRSEGMSAAVEVPVNAGRATDGVPTLTYHNVVKRFDSLTVLNGVSMEVRRKEVVCLIGPSGSGKSTLLRCTNGLELIDEGEVVFDGKPLPRDWSGMRRMRRRMGMVFQNFELFPHKTAL